LGKTGYREQGWERIPSIACSDSATREEEARILGEGGAIYRSASAECTEDTPDPDTRRAFAAFFSLTCVTLLGYWLWNLPEIPLYVFPFYVMYFTFYDVYRVIKKGTFETDNVASVCWTAELILKALALSPAPERSTPLVSPDSHLSGCNKNPA
jgi:hypothetical protein